MERIYKSPAPDFELSQIILNNTKAYKSKTKTAQILIVIEGEAEITEGNTTLSMQKGDSGLLLANSSFKITTLTDAVLYKATAP